MTASCRKYFIYNFKKILKNHLEFQVRLCTKIYKIIGVLIKSDLEKILKRLYNYTQYSNNRIFK